MIHKLSTNSVKIKGKKASARVGLKVGEWAAKQRGAWQGLRPSMIATDIEARGYKLQSSVEIHHRTLQNFIELFSP